jgi:hypothetical protein
MRTRSLGTDIIKYRYTAVPEQSTPHPQSKKLQNIKFKENENFKQKKTHLSFYFGLSL